MKSLVGNTNSCLHSQCTPGPTLKKTVVQSIVSVALGPAHDCLPWCAAVKLEVEGRFFFFALDQLSVQELCTLSVT